MLCAGNSELGEVDIKCGIFQGDSLSLLVCALALWDFSIQTDNVIETWRPYLVVVDKKRRTCKITTIPGDGRTEEKEKEKTEKY